MFWVFLNVRDNLSSMDVMMDIYLEKVRSLALVTSVNMIHMQKNCAL